MGSRPVPQHLRISFGAQRKGKNRPHQNPITRFHPISHLGKKPSLTAKRPRNHRLAPLAPSYPQLKVTVGPQSSPTKVKVQRQPMSPKATGASRPPPADQPTGNARPKPSPGRPSPEDASTGTARPPRLRLRLRTRRRHPKPRPLCDRLLTTHRPATLAPKPSPWQTNPMKTPP